MVMRSMTFPGDLFADLDDFQRQFERLFSLRASPSSSIRSVGRGAFPPVNIGSTPEAVEVFAFLPGIDAGSLDVSVDKGLLTIAGERKPAESAGAAGEQQTVFANERPFGPFRRVIALPDDADPAKVAASYRNGVLKVRVEKREASRPRRIEVAEAH
jgi:HSP20 family protein